MILKPKCFVFILFLLFTIASSQAQDYQISFAGTGASSTVGSVTVENLTQGKSITLSGTETLHLVATITGTNPIIDDANNALRIYPNPMIDNSTIDFVASASGKTIIELFDIAGRKIGSLQNTLTSGTHSFRISGLQVGIYTVKISSQAYTYTGKLVSSGTSDSDLRISYIGNSEIPITTKKLKSANNEKIMQYKTGDRLKFTGFSGIYSTILTDIPTQNKAITFTFIACTDADGNNYPIIQLGTQFWMGENLKTTKYSNGETIQNITDNLQWSNFTTGAQCSYNNDEVLGNKYGKLYNWYAVNDSRNIAPAGWHVPINEDLTVFLDYLTSKDNSGSITLASTTDWLISSNSGAIGNDLLKNNSSGFTALPGGIREDWGLFGDMYGTFVYLKFNGFWWSSTEKDATHSSVMILDYNDNAITLSNNHKKNSGGSIRCVREITINASVPTISTSEASSITITSATCGGNITSNGGATVTQRGICYNTSQNPTINSSKIIIGSGSGTFTKSITGLIPNTTYYVRAYATNSQGTAYGDQINFKTTSAEGSGTVTDIDGNVYHTVTIGTQVWMVENLKTTKYNDGTSIRHAISDSDWAIKRSSGYCWYYNEPAYKTLYGALYNEYAVRSDKLCPKGWHVPTKAEWTKLISYLGGESITGGKLKEAGTTHWLSPNMDATNETGFTALPGGNRNQVGTFSAIGRGIGDYGYWWSSTVDEMLGLWCINLNSQGGNIEGKYSDENYGFSVRCIKDETQKQSGGTITDIEGNIYLTDTIGTQIWMLENLKTTKYNDGTSIPSVINNDSWASLSTPAYCWYNNDIANKSIYGTLYNWHTVNTGKLAPTGWHVPTESEWSTLFDYLRGGGFIGGKLKERGTSHWDSPNTDATNESGFTALPGGSRGGGFNGLGQSGFWWSSTESASLGVFYYLLRYNENYVSTVSNPYDIKQNGFSVRCIKDNIAINIVIPTLSTKTASNINTTSTSTGGNITSNGGTAIIARGVCWNTTGTPTIADNKTTDVGDNDSFTSNITGLTPNTTYYVRAYATNSQGTAYGDQINFKTTSAEGSGTVTDIDGNVYHTVTIGTQVWMVENLKTTKYNDGTSIPSVIDNYIWGFLSTPAYCWYNNSITNKSTYGALYNWYSVNTGKLAPNGWHVPSDAEWTILTTYLGGESISGGKLKEIGTNHWTSPNTGATNETGFTGVPGGYRNAYGNYVAFGNDGCWWSSTGLSADAFYRSLSYFSNEVIKYDPNIKSFGLSVRCVKDN